MPAQTSGIAGVSIFLKNSFQAQAQGNFLSFIRVARILSGS
jgi:hypothetical protein